MAATINYEILLKAKEGDKKAFDVLHKILEPQVKRFTRRLLGQSGMEDDIAQDAFLALYMNLERIDPIDNLRPFLFRIVRNLCYDELRKRGRYKIHDIESVSQDDSIHPSSFSIPVSEKLHWTLLYLEVQRAIDRLPELQREAIILYVEEDLTYEAIALVMNVSIGTVKSRIHYARANLVKLLEPNVLNSVGISIKEDHNGRR